ncbi:MAG TPA: hypothetical protein VK752_12350 [Bryobacteraceae bacterium]|jgi:hypothetical protein|nr:hypothetical protein [Bryobacteraceae bacterium]
MHVAPEIQFQISLLNIASLGEAERQAQELEKLLDQQLTAENR